MKIYIIRHGETNINVENRINSLNDEDLNEEGIKQAENLRKNLKNIKYDLIICSPLTRTRHTASLINVNNSNIIIDKRLIERDAGVFTKKLINEVDVNDWYSLEPKKDYKDAETVIHLIDRVYNFLNEIKEKYAGKNIILVTHGGTSKALVSYFNGIPADGNLQIYKQKNCEILEYEL